MTDKRGMVAWDRAQAPFLELSRKLGDLVQGQLSQQFKGSPGTAQTAAVRQLRTTAAPAIAVEVSSVTVDDRAALERMAPGVAGAIARGVAAFRPIYEASPAAGTLPPDAALLEFYLLPDGTAITDFSEALATSTPSGIQSEQLAVDSIARTLEADVPQVQRMRILIHGQEMETLAGHLDLTGTFVVNTNPAPATISQPSAPSAPETDKASAEPGKLTPGSAPGKLAQPGHKPRN